MVCCQRDRRISPMNEILFLLKTAFYFWISWSISNTIFFLIPIPNLKKSYCKLQVFIIAQFPLITTQIGYHYIQTFNMLSPEMRITFFLFSLFIPCLSVVYPLLIRCLFAVAFLFYPLFIRCLSLFIRCCIPCLFVVAFLVYPLFIPCLFLIYPLFIRCLFVACSLFIPCLFLVFDRRIA